MEGCSSNEAILVSQSDDQAIYIYKTKEDFTQNDFSDKFWDIQL